MNNNIKRSHFFILPALLLLAACSGPRPGFRSVEASRAEKIAASEGVTVLDVRTPREYAESHLPNAINVDFLSAGFEKKLDSLDKDKKYLVYCRSGSRSAQAMDIMKKKGFQHVTNMLGGITDWKGETVK